MEEIKIKVGDTVMYSDGLKGKVVKAVPDNKFSNGLIIAEVVCENGIVHHITKIHAKDNYPDFYRIGHNVLGNKSTESYIEEQIKYCDHKIELIKKEKALLRKQLWRLKEEMVEDWRERKALRELRKLDKENQPTEEDTED